MHSSFVFINSDIVILIFDTIVTHAARDIRFQFFSSRGKDFGLTLLFYSTTVQWFHTITPRELDLFSAR